MLFITLGAGAHLSGTRNIFSIGNFFCLVFSIISYLPCALVLSDKTAPIETLSIVAGTTFPDIAITLDVFKTALDKLFSCISIIDSKIKLPTSMPYLVL